MTTSLKRTLLIKVYLITHLNQKVNLFLFSGSVVVTPSNGPSAPPPPLPAPSVSLSMVEVTETSKVSDLEQDEPPTKRFKVDVAPISH